ncbi:MAG TPA: isocitrate lyase/phosphoenolpyruvate mutase family protein [Candidatus Baltobacteraceae bacterium]|jgi:2-methylisocitrate lyase-like PEP mutase family enzyme|nr:isocitrate lyase/phosphoenolpyruvate mutase family protein [Candidatus Baltobacteraceae bacterium]
MSVTQAEKARLFAELHRGPETFLIPNPWDAGTAKMLTQLGFKALTTTSAGLAYALGKPDGAATRQETLANAKVIVDATHLPVAADLENGFGDDPEIVAETILLAARQAGLVGGSIEDATKQPGQPIYELDLAVARIRAAVDAAHSLPFPFMLVARAENFLHGREDLQDTIRRLQAYEAAGADVLYAPGITSASDIRAVCSALHKPVNALMFGSGEAMSLAQLQELGVRRVSVGSTLARAALGEVRRACVEMLERGTFTFAGRAIDGSELNRLMTVSSGQ